MKRLFLILGILIYSCSEVTQVHIDKLVAALNKINSQYRINEPWKIIETKQIDKDWILVNIASQECDTIKTSGVFTNANSDSIDIQYFTKLYFKQGLKHILEFKEDTLYYYVQDTIKKDKHFILGKYRYLYRTGNLRGHEIDYYRLYSDSLNSIRGDNIVRPLPQLTNLEKDKLVKKRHILAKDN